MLTYLFTISYQSFNRTKREILRKSVNSEVATYMRWPPLFLQSRECKNSMILKTMRLKI